MISCLGNSLFTPSEALLDCPLPHLFLMNTSERNLLDLPTVLLDDILHALLRRSSTHLTAAIRDLLCVASACSALRPHVEALVTDRQTLPSESPLGWLGSQRGGACPLLRLFVEALFTHRRVPVDATDRKLTLPMTLPDVVDGFMTAAATFQALLRCKIDVDAPGGPSFGGIYKSVGRIKSGHREVRAVREDALQMAFMRRMESEWKHELVFVLSPGTACRATYRAHLAAYHLGCLSCVPNEHVAVASNLRVRMTSIRGPIEAELVPSGKRVGVRLLVGGRRIKMTPDDGEETREFLTEFGDVLLDGGADAPSWLLRFVPRTLKDMDVW